MEKFTKEQTITALEVFLNIEYASGTARQILEAHLQELKDEKPLGTVYGPDRPFMVMSTEVGKAKDPTSGQTFEMLAAINGEPVVICKETNNMFTLDWQTILNLAVQAGIGKPLSP